MISRKLFYLIVSFLICVLFVTNSYASDSAKAYLSNDLTQVSTTMSDPLLQQAADLIIELEHHGERTSIVLIDIQNGERSRLYDTRAFAIDEETLQLSPDRTTIVFSEYTDSHHVETDIVVTDVASGVSSVVVPATENGYPANPIWSPDSSSFAYIWQDPIGNDLQLWIYRLKSNNKERIDTGATFWPVLVFGKTDFLVWEEDGQGLQYIDERSGAVYRVDIDGQYSEIDPLESLLADKTNLRLSTEELNYSGMVKPLNVRDYDGTCGNGYTGLYPTYVCTSSASHPAVDMVGGSSDIKCGTPVVAICDGVVLRTETYSLGNYSVCGNNVSNSNQGYANLGWQITMRCENVPNATLNGITYGGTIFVTYAHLSSIESGIGNNIPVNKGQKLGEVGSTGYSEAPHFHFQIEKSTGSAYPYYPSPYPVSEILARTWNPMYFIQAHEGNNSCCGCGSALSKNGNIGLLDAFLSPRPPKPADYDLALSPDLDFEMLGETSSTDQENGEGSEPFVLENEGSTGSKDDNNDPGNQPAPNILQTKPITGPPVPLVTNADLPSSANYQLACRILGMGAGSITSSSYQVVNVLGQVAAPGTSQSSSYQVLSGFLQTCGFGDEVTPTPTSTATPSATHTATPTSTAMPSATHTATPTIKASPTATATLSPSSTPVPTTKATTTATATPMSGATYTPTAAITATPTSKPGFEYDYYYYLPMVRRE